MFQNNFFNIHSGQTTQSKVEMFHQKEMSLETFIINYNIKIPLKIKLKPSGFSLNVVNCKCKLKLKFLTKKKIG